MGYVQAKERIEKIADNLVEELLDFARARYGSAALSWRRSRVAASSIDESPGASAVTMIDCEEEFDNAIQAAADNRLVIVDYSTTWCGPCKLVAPKYAEFSMMYSDATFITVMGRPGEPGKDAKKLMKREGVRAVPTFHFWKNQK